MDNAAQDKKKTFEEALARLEEIVRALENGSAPLDRSLQMFDEGVKLVKQCSDCLDHAEQRIKILTEGQNGEINEQDFKPVG